MPHEVTAAFIGAGATLAATTIPLAWSSIAARRSKHLSARRGVLAGRWEGEGGDYYVEDANESVRRFRVIMNFTAVGHTVKASAVLTEPTSSENDDLELFGMFYNDDYLQLSYYNKNAGDNCCGNAFID